MSEYDPLLIMSALNMAIVSLHRITSSGDRLILDREYDNIINNLDFVKINAPSQLIQLYQDLLTVIQGGMLREEVKAAINRTNSDNKRKNIGEIITGNVLKTFSMNPLEWLGDLAASSASEYFEQQRHFKQSGNELQLRLKREELNEYNNLQVKLLGVSQSLLRQYHLPGNYMLTQNALNIFSETVNVSDSFQRVRMLRALEPAFAMYAPYWFQRALSAHDAGNDEEAGKSFAKFNEVWRPVLKKDPYMAEAMKFKIEGLMRGGNAQNNAEEIKKCLEVMKANTELKNWANNIYMAMMYFTLGEKEKAEECIMWNIDFRFETETSGRLLAQFEEAQNMPEVQPEPVKPSESEKIPEPSATPEPEAPPANTEPPVNDTATKSDTKPAETDSSRDELMNFTLIVLTIIFILVIAISSGKNSPAKNERISLPPKQEEITDSKAQYDMGNKYYNTQDYTEAAKWYLKAANQGHAVAQFNLGWMYENGRGVPQSDTEAVKYYRLAADQNHAGAQNNLGWMYENGRGVPQSDTEAVKYYRLAADQGNPYAQCNLGFMYKDGRGVTRDDEEAVKWFRKSADQKHASAQNWLGIMYDYGRGVPQSNTEAVKYYRLAADQGEPYAQCNLGLMYKDGRGVTRDDEEAVKWFRKSADQGHARAQNKLGDMYRYGRGVPRDISEAVRLYKLAAKQGNTDAQSSLKELNETW